MAASTTDDSRREPPSRHGNEGLLRDSHNLPLTDQDVTAYRDQGFWVGPKLFDHDEVELLRGEVMRVVHGERDFDRPHWLAFPPFDPKSLSLTHIVNGWWVGAKVLEVVTLPVIGAIGARLMGTPQVRLVHDQLIYKPGQGPRLSDGAASDGAGRPIEPDGNVGWHQDAVHWNVFNTVTFCSCWIALQDTDLNNGGMSFIVGSHRWGLVKGAHSFGVKDLDGLAKKYSQGGRPWVEQPCVLEAGQVSFHSGLTFHGSGPNRTGEPRLSIVVNMMPGGTTYNEQGRQHPLYVALPSPDGQSGPHVHDGRVCGDPLFPRLWPAR